MKKTLVALIFCIVHSAFCISTATAAPAHYSKLGIVLAARQMGKLEAMNAWIQQAGYWDEWLACQVFSDDYAGFAMITNAIVESGLATSEQIAGALEAARVENVNDRVREMIESIQSLRERYHGGRLGQYILTNRWNEIRRKLPDGSWTNYLAPIIIRVDLYGDGSVWTNGTISRVPDPDPEAAKKRAEKAWQQREAVIRAWEAANLPPDLAEIRRRQREEQHRQETDPEAGNL